MRTLKSSKTTLQWHSIKSLSFLFLLLGLLSFSCQRKLDHFLVYRSINEPQALGVVDLNDQFGDPGMEQIQVLGPTGLVNPTGKKHGDKTFKIQNPDHHFTVYRIRNKEWKNRKVQVKNQFINGQAEMTIGEPTRLLVPTKKQGHEAPKKLDHYTCYRIVEGVINPDVKVNLRDQFDGYPQVEIGRSLFLCLPSEKKHEGESFPIYNEKDHLMFFQLELKHTQQIGFQNQFEQRGIQLDSIIGLLVPTEKKLLE